MKWTIVAGLAFAAAWAPRAFAADQVVLGPPPAWVKVAGDLPATAAPDDAATHVLRFDQQLHFGADGTANYAELAVRIQTPQGLSELSTVNWPWDPQFGGLTVHKLQIVRDGQIIDLLKTQKFTVIRRETNLENAVLDGRLSAILQPEDLRVGDVLDMAYTITETDPALAGHAQGGVGVPNAPIDDLRLAVVSDHGLVRWQAGEGFAGMQPGPAGTGRTVSVQMKDVQPLTPPAHAPARFRRGREVEVTDFKSWAEVSALMTPLYAKAAVIPDSSPLKAEVAKIKAASSDPKARAQAALTLVQDQVRYVALTMDDGGLVPADAAVTWTRRFGDCKGKTVLLIALLKELGVQAQPVLVNAEGGGDGMDARLPAVAPFDHVLVRAVIGGRVYWLDGTRTGDLRLDDIETPSFNWALPVQPSGASLIALVQTPLAKPNVSLSLRLDASAGLDIPAPAHAEFLFRGDLAVAINHNIANLASAQKEAALRGYLAKIYNSVTFKSGAASFDPLAREERLSMDGVLKMDWAPGTPSGRFYEADHYTIGWNANFDREPGPHADAPYDVAFPVYEQSSESIVLPNKGQGFIIQGADIDQTVAGAVFHRKSRIENGVFTMEATTRSVQPEFPAADAPAAATELKRMARTGLYVGVSGAYQMTSQELDQYQAKTLTTAADLLKRGQALGQRGRYAQAAADLQRASDLDPKSVLALTGLAYAKVMMGDDKGAQASVQKALALDPNAQATLTTAAAIATLEADYPAAIGYYSRILDKSPNDAAARQGRGGAYWAMGEVDKALADMEANQNAAPKNEDLRRLYVNALCESGHGDKALAQMEALIAASPGEASLYRMKGGVLEFLGRKADAELAYDKALTLDPSARGHLFRASERRVDDFAARMADVDEALKLEPANGQLLRRRAMLEAEMNRFDAAIGHIDALLAKDGDAVAIRTDRAFIYAKAGKTDLAAADIEWARGKIDKTATDWNALCYDQAMWNLTLDKALADCDKAAALAPRNSAILDSRAFVLLRLGRLDEALAGYDLALKSDPWLPAALFGRGLTKLKKGMVKDGQADLARARFLDPRIDLTFAQYGVTAPPAGAS